MKALGFLTVVIALAIGMGACQKPVEDGSLPADQAKAPIEAVQNWAVGEGTKLGERIAQGLAGMRGKGARVDEKGWRAYPGPSDCAGCNVVHYVVSINGEAEKYEFLVKDGGKTVIGMNDGTKLLLGGPAQRAPKPAPAAGAPPAASAAPPAAAPALGAAPAAPPAAGPVPGTSASPTPGKAPATEKGMEAPPEPPAPPAPPTGK